MEGCVEILIESKPSGYDSRPWMKTDTLPNILTGDFPLLLFLRLLLHRTRDAEIECRLIYFSCFCHSP